MTGASRKDVMARCYGEGRCYVVRGEGSARAEAEVLGEDAAIVEDGCIVTKAVKVMCEACEATIEATTRALVETKAVVEVAATLRCSTVFKAATSEAAEEGKG